MKKILVVVSSLLAILILTGCNKKENIVDNNLLVNVDQQQDVTGNLNENIDNVDVNEAERKELVSLVYSDENISIPNVNINSNDAKNINEELNKKFEKDISERNGYKASYKYNISENILSLLVENLNSIMDYTTYNVYNFDINTGKLLSTSDILGQEKSKELMEKLPEICSEEFYKYWKDFIIDKNSEGVKFIHEENQKLVANNIEQIPCYIDEERGIQIIIDIASFAGPSAYEHIVNLNDYMEQ